MKLRRRPRSVPTLQMTAMPDLIFTILFFFMIVTHLRESSPQMTFTQPQGTHLTKVKKTSSVIDIFIGQDSNTGDYVVQVNNTMVPISKVSYALKLEKERCGIYDDEISAALQADRGTPMHLINSVKQALRQANILTITYTGIDATNDDSVTEQ